MKLIISFKRLLTLIMATALIMVGLTAFQAPAAQAAVKSCTASTPAAQRPVLYPGDTGACVKIAQALLIKKTPYELPVTGYYGTQTTAAVRGFQARNGIITTGNIGPLTWAKLLAVKTPTTTTPVKPYNVYNGPTHKSVILTFDDCPKSYSSFKAVVDKARAMGVTLVLAPTGTCQAGSTFSASYARAHGQIVIGHTKTHPDLTTLSNAGIIAQIDPAAAASGLIRAPYGATNSRVESVLKSKGVKDWLWTVDTNDWRGKSSLELVRFVLANTKGGDTVLMHMQWNGFSTTALVPMVAGLRAQGKPVCNAYAKTTAPTRVPLVLPC